MAKYYKNRWEEISQTLKLKARSYLSGLVTYTSYFSQPKWAVYILRSILYMVNANVDYLDKYTHL